MSIPPDSFYTEKASSGESGFNGSSSLSPGEGTEDSSGVVAEEPPESVLGTLAPTQNQNAVNFIGRIIPNDSKEEEKGKISTYTSIQGELCFSIGQGSSSTPPFDPSTNVDPHPIIEEAAISSPEESASNPRLVEYVGDQFHNKNPHTRRTILLNPRRHSDNDPVVLYRFYQFCCNCSGKVWFSPLHRAKDGCFCRDCHHFVKPFGHVSYI
jgi:hypothetical protein